MTAGFRTRPWVLLLGIGLMVSAASGAPAASIPASAGTEPSVPVIDTADPGASMAAAERTLRLDDRVRAGLVNLGPGALDLAAAMDAFEARMLVGARLGATSQPLAGHVAGIGPLAAQPGFNELLVWATVLTTLGDFAREPKSGTLEEAETVEVAGNTGTITTTMTVQAVVSGSRLSVDITIKSKGQVSDKAMKLRATLTPGADAAQTPEWTIAWDSSTQLTTTGTCAGVSLETFTGTGDTGPTAGLMGVLGDVVVPQAGGTKRVQMTKAIGPSTNVLDATVTVEVIAGSTA